MKKTEPTVAAASPKRPNWKKYLLLVLGVLVVLTLVAAGGVYYFMTRPKPVTITSNDSVTGQIDGLTNEELDTVAATNPDANRDFTGAHAKALALSQKGEYAASAGVYKDMVATGKGSHELYVEYAAALYYSGDKQGGIKAMETAIQKVKELDTSQADKDSILKIYNNQLGGYKDEAAS